MRILSNCLLLVNTLVLARLLAPGDFGLVAMANATLAVINAFTAMPLSSALVQHDDPRDDHFATAWTMSLIRGLLIALGMVAAAGAIAAGYHEPRLAPLLYALAASVVVSNLANPMTAVFARELSFWQVPAVQVAGTLITVIVSVTLAAIYRNYWALIGGTLAGQTAAMLLSYLVMPYRPRFSLKEVRDLWSFSVWLTLSQVVNTINYRFDQVLIGRFLGRQELGFYTVGDNLAVLPTRETTTPLTRPLFPAFVAVRSDPARLSSAYQSAQALVTSIALPAGFGMALVADPLIRLAMGDKWVPAIPIIQALASVFALQTLGSLSEALAQAVGQTQLSFRRDLQAFALRMPFMLAGLYLFGMMGIVYARVLTGSFAIIFHMQVVKRITGLGYRQQFAPNVRSLVSIAAMCLVVAPVVWLLPHSANYFVKVVNVVVPVALGALTYLGLHAALWIRAGKPPGPEQFVLSMARPLLARVSRRLGIGPSAQSTGGTIT